METKHNDPKGWNPNFLAYCRFAKISPSEWKDWTREERGQHTNVEIMLWIREMNKRYLQEFPDTFHVDGLFDTGKAHYQEWVNSQYRD